MKILVVKGTVIYGLGCPHPALACFIFFHRWMLYLSLPHRYRMHALKSILFLLPFFAACKTVYETRSVQYNEIRIKSGRDEKLVSLLKPYADSLHRSMDDVIGIAATDLELGQPESSLGNVMVDIMKWSAEKSFNTQIDVTLLNASGIRLPSLPAGPFTRGKVYELMPFDNMLVLMHLTGVQLQAVMDHAAAHGGWPVAGISMQIKNKKAVNVKVANEPLQDGRTYSLVLPDYLANGGEQMEMLKDLPRENRGYLVRDGLLDYMLLQHQQGLPIKAAKDNRVSNAD